MDLRRDKVGPTAITISAAANDSAAVAIPQGVASFAIDIPSGATSAAFTAKVSSDGLNYYALYAPDGTKQGRTDSSTGDCTIGFVLFGSFTHVKLNSSAAQVAEMAAFITFSG